MRRLKKVRIIRSTERVGLMRARNIAMAAAVGPVLTVMDSHSECFPGNITSTLRRLPWTNPEGFVGSVEPRPFDSNVDFHGKFQINLGQRTTISTIRRMRPAKTQISLRIHVV